MHMIFFENESIWFFVIQINLRLKDEYTRKATIENPKSVQA
jgi:hypothetical protein